MNISTSTSTTTTLTDDDGDEFELTYAACEWIDPFVIKNDDGTAEVRYAVVDDSPMDWEWHEEGITFTEFSNGHDRNEWIENHLNTCRECMWTREEHIVEGEEDYHKFVPVTEWTDRMFWVERYSHSQDIYALTGESSQVDRQWDVSSGIGFLTVPDDFTDPEAAARATLESYTSWCNGSVYGLVTETYAHDHSLPTYDNGWYQKDCESVWGFIGTEYTEEAVKTGDY